MDTLAKFAALLNKNKASSIRYLLLVNRQKLAPDFNRVFLDQYQQLNSDQQQEVVTAFYVVIETYYDSNYIKGLVTFLNSINGTIEIYPSDFLADKHFNLAKDLLAATFDNELDILLKKFDTGYSLKLLGDFYYSITSFNKAITVYEKSILNKDSYKVRYNLANVCSLMRDFKKSLLHYKKANKMEPANEYILYNYGFTLQLNAEYEESFKVFNELSELFQSKYRKNKENVKWLDWGDHFLYNVGEPLRAIDIYEEGLTKLSNTYENRLDIRANLMNAYFKGRSFEKTDSSKRIVFNNRAWNLFDQLINSDVTISDKLLAEVYIIAGKFQEALDIYDKLEHQSLNDPDILMFIGICHHQLKNYEDSIKYLRTSLEISPNIVVRNHLADAYRANDQFAESENELNTIFEISDKNINSLLTFISLCIDMGNKTHEVNEVESISYYQRAHDKIRDVLKSIGNMKFSRKLNIHEISQLHYDLGFIEVQLAKSTSVRSSKSHLRKAITAFRNVSHGSKLYIKSKISVEKIKVHLKEGFRKQNKRQKALYRLGILLIVGTVTISLFGRPEISYGVQVDPLILSKRLEDVDVNISLDSLESIISKRTFRSSSDLNLFLNNLTYPDTIEVNLMHISELEKSPLKFKFNDANWSDPVLIMLLSMSFICILLGLIFDQVSSISVGSISIEKSASDNEATQLDFKLDRT